MVTVEYAMMLNDYHIYMSWYSIYIHGTLEYHEITMEHVQCVCVSV